MKLKEFVDNLNKLITDRPEVADFDVVTSKDAEGNGFTLVHYSPSVGHYDEEDKQFTEELKFNSVCVN